MLKSAISAAMRKLGYGIVRAGNTSKLYSFDMGKTADAAIQQVRPYTMLSVERLITLYQQVVHCDVHQIAGAFVECGVWKGGAVALMARANLDHGSMRRHIHLFDSFQEICEPDKEIDGQKAVQEAGLWSGGGCDGKLEPLRGFYDSVGGPGTLRGNKELLEQIIGYDPAYLHYHEGWFQETLPRVGETIGPIAILRLDGDWYASTKICLEHLYDKVVRGGFVIIDDYGAYEGCKKAVDEFAEKKHITAYLNHVDEVGRYWIK